MTRACRRRMLATSVTSSEQDTPYETPVVVTTTARRLSAVRPSSVRSPAGGRQGRGLSRTTRGKTEPDASSAVTMSEWDADGRDG